MDFLKKLFDRLTSTSAAGLYLILFAAAIGVATFIENDFGTSAAQKTVFKTKWFEALLVLFGATLVTNVWRFRMVRQKKWATLTFHLSMIVILIGAGVTRYFGYEGVMGIREGEAANTFLTAENHISFEAMQADGRRFKFFEPVLFASLGRNSFKKTYRLGGDELEAELLEFIPNPVENIVEAAGGLGAPILKIVFGTANGREEIPLALGQKSEIFGVLFNFQADGPPDPAAFNIFYANNELTFEASRPFMHMVMATQQRDSLAAGQRHVLRLRAMYNDGRNGFVFGDFRPSARVEVVSKDRKMASQSRAALRMRLSSKTTGKSEEVFVVGQQGAEGRPRIADLGQTRLAVSYGARRAELPFSLKLRDFQLEKYPGTENASSYASEVTLIDPRQNVRRDERIFMNNILDHGGFRFFQSSYNPDELGTYLSVNHDFWGTWISYVGYILLTVGMVWLFFDQKSRFRKMSENLSRMRESN